MFVATYLNPRERCDFWSSGNKYVLGVDYLVGAIPQFGCDLILTRDGSKAIDMRHLHDHTMYWSTWISSCPLVNVTTKVKGLLNNINQHELHIQSWLELHVISTDYLVESESNWKKTDLCHEMIQSFQAQFTALSIS